MSFLSANLVSAVARLVTSSCRLFALLVDGLRRRDIGWPAAKRTKVLIVHSHLFVDRRIPRALATVSYHSFKCSGDIRGCAS